MNTPTIIALAIISGIIWQRVGYLSFRYWWTNDCDFTTKEVSLANLAGMFGPFAWLMGWRIHRPRPTPIPRQASKILTPRREKK